MSPLSLVFAVAYAPGGRWLAAGGMDKTVKLWDTVTSRQDVILEGHKDWVSDVAFSADGETLASSSHDRTVKLWTRSSQWRSRPARTSGARARSSAPN